MVINKRAQLGEKVVIIYRVLAVVFIGLVVALVSGLFLHYHFNATMQEGQLLQRSVVKCLFPDGIVHEDLSDLPGVFPWKNSHGELFEYCRIGEFGGESEKKIYTRVEVNVRQFGQVWQANVSDGDPGIMGLCKLYASSLGGSFNLRTKQIAPSCSIKKSGRDDPNTYKLSFKEKSTGFTYPAYVKVHWGVKE